MEALTAIVIFFFCIASPVIAALVVLYLATKDDKEEEKTMDYYWVSYDGVGIGKYLADSQWHAIEQAHTKRSQIYPDRSKFKATKI